MKPYVVLACLGISVLWVPQAQATSRAIVRVNGGYSTIKNICVLSNCTIAESIGDPQGQVFLVTSQSGTDSLIAALLTFTAVVDCEPDLGMRAADASYSLPPALTDFTPVSCFGASVIDGYLNQAPVGIVRLFEARSGFGVNGAGTVGVIDTGIDANHPALAGSLVPGYDFTRNRDGADETADVTFSTPPSPDSPRWVSANVVANVTQSTAAVVDGNPTAYWGHGTMVAGIIHLVAPTAKIQAFKAFGPDGTGYTSDVLRAIYRAVQNRVNVINMSFSLPAYSTETKNAVNYANRNNVICVAAAGNEGEQTLVYPAGYSGLVMGIASTNNSDQLSPFSNYGSQLVWVGAPGEGIVTTYPYGTYAAGWGTSFSTPFVAGTVALLLEVSAACNQSSAAQAVAHATAIDSSLGYGRLDIYQAIQAWRSVLGLP